MTQLHIPNKSIYEAISWPRRRSRGFANPHTFQLDLNSGINPILEGVVPWYEWWDCRFGAAVEDNTTLINLEGQRHGTAWPRASAAAGPTFDIDAGSAFNGLPTFRTFTDNGVGRGLLTQLGAFSYPATQRMHIMAFMSAKNPGSLMAGLRILAASGTSQLLDRDNTSSRSVATAITTGGTVTATSANDAYVEDVPHVREVFRTVTNVVSAINGVDVATAAAATDFTVDLSRLDSRNATASSADRRYAIVVLASELIPDEARADISDLMTSVYLP